MDADMNIVINSLLGIVLLNPNNIKAEYKYLIIPITCNSRNTIKQTVKNFFFLLMKFNSEKFELFTI